MTAKVFCCKTSVTYRCGCYITGNIIHICDSTKSNCSIWHVKKKDSRDCEACMLEEQGGRNLAGRVRSLSASDTSAPVVARTSLVDAVSVVGNTPVGEGTSVVRSVEQLWERVEPVYYTESARRIETL